MRMLAGILVLLLLRTPLFPQIVDEYQVKAAYLYNFAKFVDWPARDFETAAAPFKFCVLNDRPFEEVLTEIVNGKSVAGHPVKVSSVETGDQFGGCHILFISSGNERRTPQIIGALRKASVLTVGETKGFVEQGGILNFVVDDNRVQFQVNHKAADAAGLHVSSRLLSVAKLVIE